MQKPKPIPELTDEEEARIQQGIASDPDNPEWTEDDFRQAKTFAEMFPELARGLAEDAEASAWLDREAVEKFQSQGPGWQERINEVLRKAVGL